MTWSDKINENVLKLIENIEEGIIFCGSIADHINFQKNNIDINVKDIDIYISDLSLISEISYLLDSNVRYIDIPSEKLITPTAKVATPHYCLEIDSTLHMDLFLIENKEDFESVETEEFILNGHKLVYVNSNCRLLQLKETIDHWLITSPLTKRTLKYLRKRMIYNELIKQ